MLFSDRRTYVQKFKKNNLNLLNCQKPSWDDPILDGIVLRKSKWILCHSSQS